MKTLTRDELTDGQTYQVGQQGPGVWIVIKYSFLMPDGRYVGIGDCIPYSLPKTTPQSESVRITSLIEKAKLMIRVTNDRDLDRVYSDWYDWDDFLNKGTSNGVAPLAYLMNNPKDVAELDAFVAAMESAPSQATAERVRDAAPELLAALRECVTNPFAHCLVNEDKDALYRRICAINDIARAAINKATGGTK